MGIRSMAGINIGTHTNCSHKKSYSIKTNSLSISLIILRLFYIQLFNLDIVNIKPNLEKCFQWIYIRLINKTCSHKIIGWYIKQVLKWNSLKIISVLLIFHCYVTSKEIVMNVGKVGLCF